MSRAEERPFGRLLRTHRIAAGLSQEELAERAGLSRRTITNLERDVSAPYRETVALLIQALDLTDGDRDELERAANQERARRAGNAGNTATTGAALTSRVDPLLATKLAIPPARSTLVPRPNLLERLQAGLRGPLTLLSAPAGSGKTTLLSAWRATPEGQRTPLAWVALDEGDNDPPRFWRYILTAVGRAVPGADTAAVALLDSGDAASAEPVLGALVNGLAEQGKHVVLVLDDYHLIEAEPIHRALTLLLEYLPPQLHILLATRVDPPLPLARLRARGQVTELRGADLRFSAPEAGEFLGTVMGLALTASEMSALEARTEGWIAGLQLAGLSLQGRSPEETARFIADFSGSHRYIVDYLFDEVLLRQTEDVQHFLLTTCILGSLSAPLCAALLHESPSPEHIAAGQEMLEWLERHNLFLIALDDDRRWYRYHYLFADALRQRQSSHLGIPSASALHRRAAAWFAQHDLVEEAITHALAGGDFDTAAALLPRAVRPVSRSGKLQGLSAWYRELPEAMLRARPQMALGYAWILLDFRDFRRAEENLQHAEVALLESPEKYSPDEREGLRAVIEADRALIAVLQGDADGAVGQAREVLARSEDAGGGTGSSTLLTARSIACIALGLGHLSRGAPNGAIEAFRGISAADHAPPAAVVPFLAAAGEAAGQRLLGKFELARLTYEQAVEVLPEDFLLVGSLHTGLADILRERNELDTALEWATHGVSLASELGAGGSERWIEWHVCDLLVLARIRQAQGDLEGALGDVREARDQLEGSTALSFAGILDAFQAQLQLATGDIAAAVGWLKTREASGGPQRIGITPPYFVYACEHLEIAPVQILVAQGRATGDSVPLRQALNLAERMRERAERLDLGWVRTKAIILQVMAHAALGEREPALAALNHALELSQPEGYIRAFADEGPPMIELLGQISIDSLCRDHAASMLAKLDEGRHT